MKQNIPIIVEQTYDSPIDNVWKAITDKDQMRKWFFPTIDSFKPLKGFQTEFNGKERDTTYLHKWKVTEVSPGKKITYQWQYEGYPGDSYVTWELSSVNKSTKLKLTHKVVESFPSNNPDFSRKSVLEGWKMFLCTKLKDFLALRH